MALLLRRVGAEFTANTVTNGSQWFTRIAALPGGGFVIVWHNEFGDGSGFGITAQRFNADGVKIGGEIQVDSSIDSDQLAPSIAALPSGGFVVTWTHVSGDPAGGGDGSGRSIRGRVFDSNGAPLGPDFQVNTIAGNDQDQSHVFALPGGGFVVSWMDVEQVNSSTAYNIRAQIFDASGAKVGQEFPVNTAIEGAQGQAHGTALAGGGFIIVWVDQPDVNDSAGLDVRGQRFDAAGNPVGGSFVVSAFTDGIQTGPEVAALADGGFVVAWQGPNFEDNTFEARAQMFDADGNKVGLELIASNSGDDVGSVNVAALQGGGFVVGWSNNQDSNDPTPVMRGQMFDADGNRFDPQFAINSAPTFSGELDLAVLPSARIVATWHTPVFDVAAQIFQAPRLGTPQADTITGSDSAEAILAGGGDDIVGGAGGDDLLDGGAGADAMSGGPGNDYFVVDDDGDTIAETSGIDTVETTLFNYTLPDNVENLIGALIGGEVGQALDGNGLNNRLTGTDGNDTLYTRGGADLAVGGEGTDILSGGGGRDLLIGGGLSTGNLVVNGSFETQDGTNVASAYIVTGGDEFEGISYRHADTLYGWQTGTGDPFQLDTSNGNVFFNTAEGDVAVDLESGDGQNQRLYQDIDGIAGGTQLVLSFAAALPVTSSSSAASSATATLEVLWNGTVIATITPTSTAMTQYSFLVTAAGGTSRIEFRETGAGSDGLGTMLDAVSLHPLAADGAADWVSYDNELDGGSAGVLVNLSDSAATLDGVLVEAGQARDTNGDFDILVGIENVAAANLGHSWVLGSEGANVIQGGTGDDVLNGAGGDDFLAGYGGADVMTGGTGDDVFLVEEAGDIVEENAGEGTDEIRTSLATYSLLGTEIENLSSLYEGTAHDFRGSAGDNVISGNNLDDIFRLMDGGADTALGGAGRDAFLFGAAMTFADTVDGGSEVDQLGIQGDYTGNNALTLGAMTNVEQFFLLSGSDTRFGDPGTNFYSYEVTSTNANVAPGGLLQIDANRLRAGENFTFHGGGETDGAFLIWGGKGVETITGGAGHDGFLFRGNGNWSPSDSVDGGSGTDQLGIRGDYDGANAIVMGANQIFNIETLIFMSGTDIRFGPAIADADYDVTMNDGNVAAGKRLTVDAAPLRVGETFAFNGAAELDGSFRIFGGQGGDSIVGSANADVIRGGNGGDALTGGGGGDIFVYRNAGESTGTGHDILADLATADRIDLPTTVSGWAAAVTGGQLSDATFDADLAAALDGTLGPSQAVLFTADAGDHAGTTFLVVDGNGDGAYTAGSDYVFELGPTAIVDTSSTALFV